MSKFIVLPFTPDILETAKHYNTKYQIPTLVLVKDPYHGIN